MKTSTPFVVSLLCSLVFLVSCSHKTLSVFFDLPAEDEKQKTAAVAIDKKKNADVKQKTSPSKEKKSILQFKLEKARVWQKAEKILPKEAKSGQVDWTAALNQGIIAPKASIDGTTKPGTASFAYDFFLPGPSSMFDAYFPHSTHTQWLQCNSCHPNIFRSPGTKMTMQQLNAGQYCGVCHGKVAFGLDACGRCHTQMGG